MCVLVAVSPFLLNKPVTCLFSPGPGNLGIFFMIVVLTMETFLATLNKVDLLVVILCSRHRFGHRVMYPLLQEMRSPGAGGVGRKYMYHTVSE